MNTIKRRAGVRKSPMSMVKVPKRPPYDHTWLQLSLIGASTWAFGPKAFFTIAGLVILNDTKLVIGIKVALRNELRKLRGRVGLSVLVISTIALPILGYASFFYDKAQRLEEERRCQRPFGNYKPILRYTSFFYDKAKRLEEARNSARIDFAGVNSI